MLSISNQPLIAPPYQVPTKTWEAQGPIFETDSRDSPVRYPPAISKSSRARAGDARYRRSAMRRIREILYRNYRMAYGWTGMMRTLKCPSSSICSSGQGGAFRGYRPRIQTCKVY